MLPFILFATFGFFTAKLVRATVFSDKPISKSFAWISAIVSAVLVTVMIAPILFIAAKHLFDLQEWSILESAKSSAGGGWLIGYLSILTMGNKPTATSRTPQISTDNHPLNKAGRTVYREPENETTKPTAPLFSKPLPEIPVSASQTAMTQAQTVHSTDTLWENAMAECNSAQRKAGLWARCFAETDGDENKAQARYIKQRVAEEQQRIDDIKLAAEQAAIEQAKRLATEAAQRLADLGALKTKGYCPSCSGVVFLDAKGCVHCKAILGTSGWKPREI